MKILIDKLFKNVIFRNIIHKPKSHGYGEFPYQDLNIKLSDKSNIKELYVNPITNFFIYIILFMNSVIYINIFIIYIIN